MPRTKDLFFAYATLLAVLAWLWLLATISLSRAEPAASSQPVSQPVPCQTASPCRVLILSREEEEALVGQNQILDTAMQGRPLDLTGKVLYFRDKIRNAPPGSNTQPEAPK